MSAHKPQPEFYRLHASSRKGGDASWGKTKTANNKKVSRQAGCTKASGNQPPPPETLNSEPYQFSMSQTLNPKRKKKKKIP